MNEHAVSYEDDVVLDDGAHYAMATCSCMWRAYQAYAPGGRHVAVDIVMVQGERHLRSHAVPIKEGQT